MSRQYKMRWSDADRELLSRTVKNFNAKINRVAKREPEAVARLPTKITQKQIKDLVTTRQEFNRLIKSYQRFSKKGSEVQADTPHRTQATKWHVQEYNINKRLENQRRAYERKRKANLPGKSRGQDVNLPRYRMGDESINSLKPIKRNFEDMTQAEFNKKFQNVNKMLFEKNRNEKKEMYRANYLKALRNEGLDDDIYDFISDMDIDSFISVMETDKEAEIDFIYDEIKRQAKNESLRQVWGLSSEDINS